MQLLFRLPIILFALVFGATGSQFPEYVQQYTQRLGGAVDELRNFVEQFDRDATSAGLTRDEALKEYEKPDSVFLDKRGESVVQTIRRYERLFAQKLVIDKSGPVGRVVAFLEKVDSDIAHKTFDDFEPAVPLTMEGGLFAAGGFFTALLVWLGLRGTGRAVVRRGQKSRTRDETHDKADASATGSPPPI